MKVLMDADCLIKLTKAGLKEVVCGNFDVVVPQTVKEEIVDNAGAYPDGMVIKKNIEDKLITLHKTRSSFKKGEEAVYSVFEKGGYAAICSDDKRFIRRLRFFDVPYITPAVFVAILSKDGKLTPGEALAKLGSLSPFISDEEYSTVKAVLTDWRKG